MKVFIDNVEYNAKPNQTILQVARENEIYIPTMCYIKDLTEEHFCDICVVQIEGRDGLFKACQTNVEENMHIVLNTPQIIEHRRTILQNLLNKHNLVCGSCAKNGCCSFQKMWVQNQAKKTQFDTGADIDNSSLSITRDYNKCIFCGKCVEVCSKQQKTYALQKIEDGDNFKVVCNDNKSFKDSHCIGCGQCILVCPTASLVETDAIEKVKSYLDDKQTLVVAQIAPAVRVAFGEEFKKDYGYFDEEKLVGVVKALGFDYVYDVSTGADFTAIEEAKELAERLKNNVNLPQFTSCCPAWFRYVEEFYPEYLDNLSLCRSPNEMLASVVRTCVNTTKNVKIVAIMPCTAKKEEISRFDSVDAVLTTRELARLVREQNINYEQVSPSKFDNPLAMYSGGGLIFGVTGGVSESVLRCLVHILSDGKDARVEFNTTYNSNGLKEISVTILDKTLNIAIVNGIGNANQVMQNIKQGKIYHFIEVMACPGGCIGGGGQPIVDRDRVDYDKVLEKRAQALYNKEKTLKVRSAILNPEVLKIYDKFLNPNPQKIIDILHRNKKNS